MEIHGDECVYIFPDLLKAVSGTFRRLYSEVHISL